MAWFSSIAGKAEQFLNQLDEAAATSLRDSGMATPSKSQTTPTAPDSFQSEPVTRTGLLYEPVAQSPPAYNSRQQQQGPPLKSAVSSSNVTPPTWDSPWDVPFSSSSPKVSRSFTSDGRGQQGRGQQAKEDDSLLDFLNSPSGGGKKKTTPTSAGSERRTKIKKSKVTTTNNNTGESTDSAQLGSHDQSHDEGSSLDSAKTDSVPFSDSTNKSPLQTTPISTPPIISYQPSQQQQQLQSKNQQTEEGVKPVEPVEGGPFTVTQKQLEEENMRLREEISYLSAELRNNKIKNDERGKAESQLKIDVSSLKKQVSQLEQLVQRMRSQEDDLKSTLESRESQIQVLRTRLLESDEKLKTMKGKMEETERAKDQFLSDVGKSSDAQNQAILSVKSQLEQSQHQLLQERENQTRLKEEFEEREFAWNKEREEMGQSLYMQGKELQMQQLKYSECHNNLQLVKQELQLLRKEHSEYKVKAAGILQAKEKVIDSLRSSSEGGGGGGERGLEAALDEMRSEKYQLQSQLINNEQVILSLRTELQEIEDSHTLEVEELRQQVTLSEETLETERQAHLTTQDELSSLQKELDSLKDELVKEKATFVGEMREKEKTIENLKSQVKNSSSQSDSSRQQLEERLKELTESLIEKQTNLEELTAEYNSTQLQLKRAETAATEAQAKIKAAASRPSHTVLNMESDSTGSGSSLQPMASMLPEADTLRPRHLRRVRNTLDSVDKIGLHVAWVLRRYPCVRLLTIGYILLLHLWVMIVLFTYQPEIHPE